MPQIGVLALQGDFREHIERLRQLQAAAVEVRTASQLAAVDALIIPGGESTTIARLLIAFDLLEPLRARIRAGMPVWGTCAGAILLAQRVPGLDRPPIGALDVTVDRNAFGRQVDSFEADLSIAGIEGGPMRAVFIRAPVIRDPGHGVKVLASLPDGRIVACRQGPLLATCFHPELTEDARLHAAFIEQARAAIAPPAHTARHTARPAYAPSPRASGERGPGGEGRAPRASGERGPGGEGPLPEASEARA